MTPTSSTQTPGASGRLDEARRRVEASRRELTDTVQALAAKADVKSRAKEKLAETRE